MILYELFTGYKPFDSLTELVDQAGLLRRVPSQLRSDLPAGLDAWLQALCAYDPAGRPSAAAAAASLADIANAGAATTARATPCCRPRSPTTPVDCTTASNRAIR